MAFVPRTLKGSQPPAKKANGPVVPHHVTDKETVAWCESTIASGYPHSESACISPVYNPTAGGTIEGSSDTGQSSPTDSPGRPASSKEGDPTIDEDSDNEPVVSYCKDHRWPLPGEPVCVVCDWYAAYISDTTADPECYRGTACFFVTCTVAEGKTPPAQVAASDHHHVCRWSTCAG